MAPHHHDADARLRAAADGSPVACKPEIAVGDAKLAAQPPAAPRARPPVCMRNASARVPHGVFAAPVRVMAHAMRMRRAMNRWVMFVWTRVRVGWREGDHAGEQKTRRHKFLLHHHSFCWRTPQARTERAADC